MPRMDLHLSGKCKCRCDPQSIQPAGRSSKASNHDQSAAGGAAGTGSSFHSHLSVTRPWSQWRDNNSQVPPASTYDSGHRFLHNHGGSSPEAAAGRRRTLSMEPCGGTLLGTKRRGFLLFFFHGWRDGGWRGRCGRAASRWFRERNATKSDVSKTGNTSPVPH